MSDFLSLYYAELKKSMSNEDKGNACRSCKLYRLNEGVVPWCDWLNSRIYFEFKNCDHWKKK